MKIYGDRASAGLAAEKNEKPGKISQTSKSGSNPVVIETKDDLELTGKKLSMLDSARETELTNAAAVEVDASEIPTIKEKLQVLNKCILSNPADALSSQANLNPSIVAGLVG